MKTEIYTQKGTKTKKSIDLANNVFNSAVKNDLMTQAVYIYNSNQRLGTQKTKSRSEVSGGGRKPWRQKTPDRARHGSTRSPIWVGGGHAHAIQPRNWRLKLPKKMRQGALFSALSYKLSNGNLKIVDKIEIKDKELTKQVLEFYNEFGKGQRLVIITKDKVKNLVLGAKSLDKVKIMLAENITTFDILAHDELVILEDAIKKMNEVWGKPDKKASKPEEEESNTQQKEKKTPAKISEKNNQKDCSEKSKKI